MTRRVSISFGVAVVLVLSACSAQAPSSSPSPGLTTEVLAAWTQLGPDGSRSVRLVTSLVECPTADLDYGQSPSPSPPSAATLEAVDEIRTEVRVGSSAPAFPYTVCEAALPDGVVGIGVGGVRLRVSPDEIESVAVVGDTGCSSVDARAGDCAKPMKWPFPRIATSAADAAPDLVVHTGNMVFRVDLCTDGPCPSQVQPPTQPIGWADVNDDFFAPAAPLLRAASWVFVRGDHAKCTANGKAWDRYFAPGPFQETCRDTTAPFRVPMGSEQLIVFDSSAASNDAPDGITAIYRDQFGVVGQLAAGRSTWFLTHKPMWAPVAVEVDGNRTVVDVDQSLQKASGDNLPVSVEFALGGNVSLFEVFQYAGARVPQVVIANSGAPLGLPFVESPVGIQVAGAEVTAAITRRAFGYGLFERSNVGWELSFADVWGARLFTCEVGGKAIECPFGRTP